MLALVRYDINSFHSHSEGTSNLHPIQDVKKITGINIKH